MTLVCRQGSCRSSGQHLLLEDTCSFLKNKKRLSSKPAIGRRYSALGAGMVVERPSDLKPFPDGGHPPAAIISDLDGTLLESELLKARSYAKTVTILLESQDIDELRLLDVDHPPSKCIQDLQDHHEAKGTMQCSAAQERHDIAQKAADAAIDSYLSNIGGTTESVAKGIVENLHLQTPLLPKMQEYSLDEPWRALYRWRKEIYASTFATDANLYDARYTHNIEMLHRAAAGGIPVAVATQSTTDDAVRVTKVLGVYDALKAVLGREKVAKPKPDPDIYLAAARELGVPADQCLVFEDSVTGLTAALKAGMQVVAVPNPFSKPLLKAQTLLSQDAIVYDLKQLDQIVARQCALLSSKHNASTRPSH